MKKCKTKNVANNNITNTVCASIGISCYLAFRKNSREQKQKQDNPSKQQIMDRNCQTNQINIKSFFTVIYLKIYFE